MANLKLSEINKIYDNNQQAVFDFNLDIKDKEFVVFVGPSGCGKSTTLRMIAGLENISSGEILIDDKVVNDVEPKDRDIAMVFQSYALYPHMTVYGNMAFGLTMRKMPKEEIKQRVDEAAEILGLTDLLDRKPKALSGGQRQRVALGRAIVRSPKVFLMDEPLSNLDAKLRVVMRSEIIKLHKNINATTIYVTHDQTEAMTMADKIVVMNGGYIQQIGTPREVYESPKNIFVASFIGAPAMNFISGKIVDGFFIAENIKIKIAEGKLAKAKKHSDLQDVCIGIRPEDLFLDEIVKSTYVDSQINIEISFTELLGHETIIHGILDNEQNFIAKVDSRYDFNGKNQLIAGIDINKVHIFDNVTKENISL